jgi:MFS family permease
VTGVRATARRPAAYLRVVASSGTANLGDGIREVALPLLAAAITRDTLLVSGLTACAYAPWLLLSMPIGALVDRGRPELYLFGAGVARCVLLTVLCVDLLAGDRSLVLLYCVAFLLGVGEAAYDNASQSLIPRVVPDRDLEKANGALVTAERLGEDLAGPAVGGVLFTVSAALPFVVNAVSLGLGTLLVAGLRTPPPAGNGSRPVRGLLREAGAGMRWLWRADLVRGVIATGAALTFLTQTWEPLLVLLVTGSMGVPDIGYGIILALGAAGGIAGAAVTPALARRCDHGRLRVAALGVTGAADLALAAVPSPPMAALALGLASAAFALWNVLSVSLRQRLVPPDVLARVNAASRTLSMTAAPLGALAGGWIAHALGLRAPLWASGAALVVLAPFAARLWRPRPGGGDAAPSRPARS